MLDRSEEEEPLVVGSEMPACRQYLLREPQTERVRRDDYWEFKPSIFWPESPLGMREK